MMTLGCGVRLDRVPSGQTIASPDNNPRRPSLHITTGPSRVQACASADPAGPRATTAAIAAAPIENAQLMVMSPPQIGLPFRSPVLIASGLGSRSLFDAFSS